ncbi:ankyrin repeat-containing domain protein [Gorgonomyces haynaldii]|nr:ankyrin repeat-containing domain protein [Gorgonomyces haynaldii]
MKPFRFPIPYLTGFVESAPVDVLEQYCYLNVQGLELVAFGRGILRLCHEFQSNCDIVVDSDCEWVPNQSIRDRLEYGITVKPFQLAIVSGNVQLCQMLIESEVDVNDSQSNEMGVLSPVEIAVTMAHFEVLQLLHNHGAIIDDPALLLVCVQQEDTLIFDWLRNQGLDLQSMEDLTLLHECIKRSSVFVDYLIEKAEMIGLEWKTDQSLIAAAYSNLTLVQMITRERNVTDLVLQHALLIAAEHGNLQICEFLMENGLVQKQPKSSVMRVSSKSVDGFKCLLENNAPLDHLLIPTVIKSCIEQRRPDIIQLLLKFNPKGHASTTGSDSCLLLAKIRQEPKIYHLLLDYFNCQDSKPSVLTATALELDAPELFSSIDNTLLHICCIRGKPNLVSHLIENGADLQQYFKYGRSLLHIAASHNHLKVCQILIQH